MIFSNHEDGANVLTCLVLCLSFGAKRASEKGLGSHRYVSKEIPG
jgi:hypothetical protein